MGKRYSHDMSGETRKKQLLPEGWREFKIMDCNEAMSKKGNPMFIFIFRDVITQQDEEVYAISTQGKRWFLKGILAACGVPAAQDGVYDWDTDDVLDKNVMGLVTHFDDKWINRESQEVTTKKHKIGDVAEAIFEGEKAMPKIAPQEETPF